jgi:GMP synthase (glutamine-hydrolysing)
MILIIQTGDPVALAEPYGSFADYFINGMEVTSDQVKVVDVHRGQRLPDINQSIRGIIITGSAAMVTEQASWMLQTQRWLEKAIEEKIPTLGVCFGHQLLADMLGGEVGYNPLGRNMGHSVCRLTEAGQQDHLLNHLSDQTSFNTLVSHQQAVLKLPQSVTLLATCDKDNNHVFRYQDHVWAVQFHPEWTKEIMQAYIKQRQQDLRDENLNPDLMVEQLQPSDNARQLLVNFSKLSELKQ